MNTYQDEIEIDTLDGLMTVTIATFGRSEELGAAEQSEPCPIRLRVADDEDNTAEAYLSLEEAGIVIAELTAAIDRAKTFPR